MHAVIGFIAGFIAFTSFIPYVISIFKGETKPQRATFAIWSAINLVTLLSYFASGARETIWVLAVYTIFQIGVFLLSFKYGMGGLEKIDLVCVAGAAIGIVAWIATKDPATALYISIAVEFLGWLPLIRKVYLHPETENTLSWSLAGIAAFLNLFALMSLQPDIISYPIYLFLSEGAIAMLLLFPHLRFHNQRQNGRPL